MAAHTYNLSAKREAALAAIVSRINARRVAWNAAHPTDPPKAPITVDEYMAKRIAEVVDSYVDQEAQRAAIAGLTASQKADLKLTDPVDDPNDFGGLP